VTQISFTFHKFVVKHHT